MKKSCKITIYTSSNQIILVKFICRNGITLIRDFIQIANGQRPQWLPNVSQINYKNIGI